MYTDSTMATSDAGQRLEAVLEAVALISHESHGHNDTELVAFFHRDEQVARAQQQLRDMIRDLLTEAAETGAFRDDVAPDELASYCLHALTAAGSVPSKAAVRRLVTVTVAGLHPRRPASDDRQERPHGHAAWGLSAGQKAGTPGGVGDRQVMAGLGVRAGFDGGHFVGELVD